MWLLALLIDGNKVQHAAMATGTDNKQELWPWAFFFFKHEICLREKEEVVNMFFFSFGGSFLT